MIARIIIVLLAIGVVFSSCGHAEKKTTMPTEVTPAAADSNDLPAMDLLLTTGKKLSLQSVRGKTIVVMFQPDCDHCQREARQFQQNLPSFKAYQLYFVSSAPVAELATFATAYGLSAPNVHFGTTTVEQVLNTYGPIDAPSVYLYDDDGKLVQQFNGEVDISVVLKYL